MNLKEFYANKQRSELVHAVKSANLDESKKTMIIDILENKEVISEVADVKSVMRIKSTIGSLIVKHGLPNVLYNIWEFLGEYRKELNSAGMKKYGMAIGKISDLLAQSGSVAAKEIPEGTIPKEYLEK